MVRVPYLCYTRIASASPVLIVIGHSFFFSVCLLALMLSVYEPLPPIPPKADCRGQKLSSSFCPPSYRLISLFFFPASKGAFPTVPTLFYFPSLPLFVSFTATLAIFMNFSLQCRHFG